MHNKSYKLKIVRDALTKGQGVYNACRSAGIEYSTLWTWRKGSARIDRYITRILQSRTQLVEDALFKSALSGSNFAQTFWLKNRGLNWKDSPVVDQSSHMHLTKIEVKVSDDTAVPLTQESRDGVPSQR